MDNYSIYSTLNPTNEDVIVTFKPKEDTTSYICRVYNNGILIDVIKKTGNKEVTITLKDSGNLYIIVKGIDSFGREDEYKSGNYIIDKEPPQLAVGESNLLFYIGDKLDVMGGVKAKDNIDGDITSSVTTNIDEINLEEAGIRSLIYSVSDKAGNVTTKTVTLNIIKKDITGLLIIQSGIIILLTILIVFISRYRKNLNIEKRYGKYSVEPLVDQTPSLSEHIASFYK